MIDSNVLLIVNANSDTSMRNMPNGGKLGSNCSNTLMLKDLKSKSTQVQLHGHTLYAYPGKIGKSYTGCKTIWLESGRKLSDTAL